MSGQISFPKLKDRFSKRSATYKKYFWGVNYVSLTLLILASFVASFFGDSKGIVPIVSLILFILSIVLPLSGVAGKFEREWRSARSNSEEIKSASWQLAVGGSRFPLSDNDAEKHYGNELKEMASNAEYLEYRFKKGETDVQIPKSILCLRECDIADRIDVYKKQRIDNQLEWYSNNISKNATYRRRFQAALVVTALAALILGVLWAKDYNVSNYFGFMSTLTMALLGCVWVGRFDELSLNYNKTAREVERELSRFTEEAAHENEINPQQHDCLLVGGQEGQEGEENWAEIVDKFEEIFAREHSLWLDEADYGNSSSNYRK